ncbi:MAG: hypothetical protein JEZ07_13260 [Phycisphaerae bacterium]|nr:hypothetical protein [Phycisphaerae bacterium]
MAKKINRKLLALLLAILIPLFLFGVWKIDQRYAIFGELLGNGPESWKAKAIKYSEELEAKEAEFAKELAAIEDPQQRWDKRQEEFSTGGAINKLRDDAINALYHVRKFAKDKESYTEITMEISEAYLKIGAYSSAMKEWEGLLTRYPGQYEVTRRLVELKYENLKYYGAQLGANDLTELSNYGQKLIDLKSDAAFGYVVKAHADVLAMQLVQEGMSKVKPEEIAKMLDKAVELEPKYYQSYYVRALLEIQVNGTDDSKSADLNNRIQSILLEGIKANPENVEGYLNYVRLMPYGAQLDFENANKTLLTEVMSDYAGEIDKWIEKFPEEAQLYVLKAGKLSKIIQTDSVREEIINLYIKAIELDKTLIDCYFNLASHYIAFGDAGGFDTSYYKKALLALREGIYNEVFMHNGYPRQRAVEFQMVNRLLPEAVITSTRLIEKTDDEIYEQYAASLLKKYETAVGAENVNYKVLQILSDMAKEEDQQTIKLGQLYELEKNWLTSSDPKIANSLIASAMRWKLFEILRQGDYKTMSLGYVLGGKININNGYQCWKIIETMCQLGLWPGANNVVELYENNFDESDKYFLSIQSSKAQIKWQLAKIRERQLNGQASTDKTELEKNKQDIAEAKQLITKLESGKLENDILKVQIIEDQPERLKALEALAVSYPQESGVVNSLLPIYMQSQQPSYKQAQALLQKYLEKDPDILDYQILMGRLSEPDPGNISDERSDKIELDAIGRMKDDYKRNYFMAKYYSDFMISATDDQQREDYFAKSQQYCQKAFDLAENESDKVFILGYSLGLAYEIEDETEVDRLIAEIESLDSTAGLRAKALDCVQKEQWSQAQDLLQKYLAINPIAADIHLTLSDVYGQLINSASSVAEKQQFEAGRVSEIKEALAQQPGNILANYKMALSLYQQGSGKGEQGELQLSQALNAITIAKNGQPSDSFRMNLLSLELSTVNALIKIKEDRLPFVSPRQEGDLKKEIIDGLSRADKLVDIFLKVNPDSPAIWLEKLRLAGNLTGYITDKSTKDNIIANINKKYEDLFARNITSPELLAERSRFIAQYMPESEFDPAEMLKGQIDKLSGDEKISKMYELSRLYGATGKGDDQIATLEEIYKVKPEYIPAAYSLAEIYGSPDKGKSQQAADIMMKLRKIEDNFDFIASHANYLFATGDYDSVKTLIEEMSQKYSEQYQIGLFQANYNLLTGNYIKANEYIDKFLAVDTTNSSAYLVKARALYHMDKLYDSQDMLRRAKNLTGADLIAISRLQEMIYERQKQYRQAVNELQTILKAEPADTNALVRLTALCDKHGLWDEIQSLITSWSGSSDVNVFLSSIGLNFSAGKYYINKSDKTKADFYFNQALAALDRLNEQALKNEAFGHLVGQNRSDILLAKGDFQAVIDAVDEVKVTEITLSGFYMLLNKAEAMAKLGDNGAYKQFEQTMSKLESVKELAVWQVGISQGLVESGNAELWLTKYLQDHKGSTLATFLLAGIKSEKSDFAGVDALLGKIAKGQGQSALMARDRLYKSAYDAKLYDKMVGYGLLDLQAKPDEIIALNKLAYAYLLADKEIVEATEMAKKAYESARTIPAIIDTYAALLIRQGKYQQGYDLLLRAITAESVQGSYMPLPPAEYAYHLALALEGLGRTKEAEARLKSALEQLEEFDSKDEIRWREPIQKMYDRLTK